MSDTPTTPEATPATPVQETPPAETFSLDYVKTLRDEAAKYRTEKKDAVEAARAALTSEWEGKLSSTTGEVTRLTTDLGDAWVELAKVYAALDAKVPSDKVRAFASVLKGSDADSISESAKSAKELFGVGSTGPAVDPTQGSGGGTLPLNGDPLLNALKAAVGA